ncbi:MAG: hypothetical protein DRJ41_00235 [Thermoprotei archaeon]|nr:MAG: hypothetical protein DRJ41_00235 [Thermoprotei archaeon]
MRGLEPELWRKVIKSIEDIVVKGCYVSVNRFISFSLDSYLRGVALRLVKGSQVVLDCGCGPAPLLNKIEGEVICLDPSYLLLKILRKADSGVHPVCGIAEMMPLRDKSVDASISLFSVRDFMDRCKAVLEYERVTKLRVVIVDVFKPENFLLRLLAAAYLSFIVPLMALALAGRTGYRWRLLYDTFNRMVSPKALASTFKHFRLKTVITFFGGFLSLIDLVKVYE